jgi:hypothetical protein
LYIPGLNPDISPPYENGYNLPARLPAHIVCTWQNAAASLHLSPSPTFHPQHPTHPPSPPCLPCSTTCILDDVTYSRAPTLHNYTFPTRARKNGGNDGEPQIRRAFFPGWLVLFISSIGEFECRLGSALWRPDVRNELYSIGLRNSFLFFIEAWLSRYIINK